MEVFNSKYPSTKDLRSLASKKIPTFAFEYLDGGCNEDVNITSCLLYTSPSPRA